MRGHLTLLQKSLQPQCLTTESHLKVFSAQSLTLSSVQELKLDAPAPNPPDLSLVLGSAMSWQLAYPESFRWLCPELLR